MSRRPVIAPLRPEQVPAAARLVAQSFEPRWHPYMSATQSGAAAFLAAYVEAASLHPERHYLAATWEAEQGSELGGELGSELAGYAEFRRLEDGTAFLSYICVAPQARGQGLAAQLIEAHLSADPQPVRAALDVFADNAPALSLYRRLGFTPRGGSVWWRRPLPPAPHPPRLPGEGQGLHFDNWPHALASLERYGLCEYRIRWRGEALTLGRLGCHVLRCTRPADFADTALLAAVHAALPDLREALLVTPDTAPLDSPSADAEAFHRSLRLVRDRVPADPGADRMTP